MRITADLLMDLFSEDLDLAVKRTLLLVSSYLSDIPCLPWEAEVSDLIRVVLRYVDEHPERLHENRSFVVRDALNAAYPCG